MRVSAFLRTKLQIERGREGAVFALTETVLTVITRARRGEKLETAAAGRRIIGNRISNDFVAAEAALQSCPR